MDFNTRSPKLADSFEFHYCELSSIEPEYAILANFVFRIIHRRIIFLRFYKYRFEI